MSTQHGAPGTDLAARLDAALRAPEAAAWPALDAPARACLLDLIALLARWNRVYNLTAVRTPEAMLARHVFDSLSVTPWVRGPRVLDAGTGAGLPGLVLATAMPAARFVLLDSNAKKTRFCMQAAAELRLRNVRVEHVRLERYRPAACFDTVVSRAYAALAAFARVAGPLRAPGGALLAMKGQLPAAELAEARAMGENARVFPVPVPGLGEERHVVLMPLAPGAEERVAGGG